MQKLNKKQLIPFILFIFMCMLIYTKFGIIEVRALSLDLSDKVSNRYKLDYYYAQGNTVSANYGSNYTAFNDTNPLHFKIIQESYYPKSTPYRFGFRFDTTGDILNNYISSNSNPHVNVVLHFRFYYDIRNNDYWIPYREFYNSLYGSSSVHESSSGSIHGGGGGVSFGEENSGDYDITGEELFYQLDFYGEVLDLYNMSWGFTNSDDSTFCDVYAWYQGNPTLTTPLSAPDGYYALDFHIPYEKLVVEEENNRTMTALEIMDYFGYTPSTAPGHQSYVEISSVILSDEHQEYVMSDYYDEDSCLVSGSCQSTYQNNDSTPGLLKSIINKITAIGQGLLSLPENIYNLFAVGLPNFENLISTGFSNFLLDLVENFKELFIPQEGFLNSTYSTTKSLFEEKFGILLAPATVFTHIADRFNALSNDSVNNFVINVPEISIPFFDVPIINSTSYDLSEVLDQSNIKVLWTLYLDFIDVFMIISFLNLSWNKLNSIIGGQIVDTDYYTESDSETYNTSTGELLYGLKNIVSRHSEWRSKRI